MTRQSEEGHETHRPGMATATGQSEVSGETPRPETVADSRSEMEESEVPSRDKTPGPSEPDHSQKGQVTARKHKLSKDREPTKSIPRFIEHKDKVPEISRMLAGLKETG